MEITKGTKGWDLNGVAVEVIEVQEQQDPYDPDKTSDLYVVRDEFGFQRPLAAAGLDFDEPSLPE